MVDVREIEKKIKHVRKIRDTLGDEPEVDEAIINELESGITELGVERAFIIGRLTLKNMIFLGIADAVYSRLPNVAESFFRSVVIIISLIIAFQLIKESHDVNCERDLLIDLENEYYDIIEGVEEDENAKGR